MITSVIKPFQTTRDGSQWTKYISFSITLVFSWQYVIISSWYIFRIPDVFFSTRLWYIFQRILRCHIYRKTLWFGLVTFFSEGLQIISPDNNSASCSKNFYLFIFLSLRFYIFIRHLLSWYPAVGIVFSK